MKGFYINKGQETLWDKPIDEYSTNSSWKWDFDKYGSCVRFDIPPVKIEGKFTACFKVQHDRTDWFNMFQSMSTKSGKSVVDELKSKP